MTIQCFRTTCLIIISCYVSAFAGAEIHGAGATFPALVYTEWAKAYAQIDGKEIRYDAVGSGQGIAQIRQHTVDFGASDTPLTATELATSGLMQFPVIIGGVVPIINISGIKPGALRLSGPVLADIYLGRIHKWNELPIAQLNPTLQLPNANITVVHRSDYSGSSLLWTDYLSHMSSVWQASVGVSMLPTWPVGVGGIGNEGVASYVQRTRFAIGYVEFAYARAHRLSDVSLRNHDGNFVQAQRETFHAAAMANDWSDLAHFQRLMTDPPGPESWPITAASFILVSSAPEHSARALEVIKFFNWALHYGAVIARTLDYEPIPDAAIEQLPKLWREKVRDGGGNPVWP